MGGWQEMEERDAELKADHLHDENIRKEEANKYIQIVINKKNCNKYFVINKFVRNCTNEQDGQMMVLYRNEEGQVFVRESSEFWEKFVIIE